MIYYSVFIGSPRVLTSCLALLFVNFLTFMSNARQCTSNAHQMHQRKNKKKQKQEIVAVAVLINYQLPFSILGGAMQNPRFTSEHIWFQSHMKKVVPLRAGIDACAPKGAARAHCLSQKGPHWCQEKRETMPACPPSVVPKSPVSEWMQGSVSK